MADQFAISLCVVIVILLVATVVMSPFQTCVLANICVRPAFFHPLLGAKENCRALYMTLA